jgi:hypothetical protein
MTRNYKLAGEEYQEEGGGNAIFRFIQTLNSRK